MASRLPSCLDDRTLLGVYFKRLFALDVANGELLRL
jgi:hypothetical protein